MRIRAFSAIFAAATAVVAVSAAPASAADGVVINAGAPGAIPGRYLVTVADAQVSARGAGQAGTRTYGAGMTAAQARKLAAKPGVRFVEQDRTVRIAEAKVTAKATQQNPAWGLDRIDQRSATLSRTYTPMDDGSGATAYVIDTGIRTTHLQFGGRAVSGRDFVDGDNDASDCNGHGTHVAGTIGGATYGVAKQVKLVAVRVLDCDGEGTLSGVIAGVNWVTAHASGPSVANMSMGGGYSPSLEAAVQKSINKGITYVVAAGNEDMNATNASPAGLPAAITVGATDARDRRASFSNYGSVLDLFAPGVNIRSSVANSDTATDVYSGTSMAAPHVAGAVAMVLDAYPALTPAQVRNFLVGQATVGKVSDRAGSVNRLLFTPPPVAAPAITTSSLSVTPFTAYTGKLTLGSVRRGSWSIAAGKLPSGLTLSPSGVITGTPLAGGTPTVTVRFTDYVPNVVTRVITIKALESDPEIEYDVLPEGAVGSSYEFQLMPADTRTGQVWRLEAGDLPSGLTLGADGLLSGVPDLAGTSTFTVRLTDSWGKTVTKDLTITVA